MFVEMYQPARKTVPKEPALFFSTYLLHDHLV